MKPYNPFTPYAVGEAVYSHHWVSTADPTPSLQPELFPEHTVPIHYLRYDMFVGKLMKPRGTLSAEVGHCALGIAGEAGEIVDAIKKHSVYNKPLDLTNLTEELGDMLFYIQALCNLTGIKMNDVYSHNAVKLSKRYAGLTYTDKAAQDREDKK